MWTQVCYGTYCVVLHLVLWETVYMSAATCRSCVHLCCALNVKAWDQQQIPAGSGAVIWHRGGGAPPFVFHGGAGHRELPLSDWTNRLNHPVVATEARSLSLSCSSALCRCSVFPKWLFHFSRLCFQFKWNYCKIANRKFIIFMDLVCFNYIFN